MNALKKELQLKVKKAIRTAKDGNNSERIKLQTASASIGARQPGTARTYGRNTKCSGLPGLALKTQGPAC